jgi:hypothetical protein
VVLTLIQENDFIIILCPNKTPQWSAQLLNKNATMNLSASIILSASLILVPMPEIYLLPCANRDHNVARDTVDTGYFYDTNKINDYLTGKVPKFRISASGWDIDSNYKFSVHTADGGNFYYQCTKEDIESMFTQMRQYLNIQ